MSDLVDGSWILNWLLLSVCHSIKWRMVATGDSTVRISGLVSVMAKRSIMSLYYESSSDFIDPLGLRDPQEPPEHTVTPVHTGCECDK